MPCATDIDLEYCEMVVARREDSELVKFKDLPPVETAVCISHHGDYNSFDGTMAEALRYIEAHNLEICDEPRFCYIHGASDCDEVADRLTKVRIPVAKGRFGLFAAKLSQKMWLFFWQ